MGGARQGRGRGKTAAAERNENGAGEKSTNRTVLNVFGRAADEIWTRRRRRRRRKVKRRNTHICTYVQVPYLKTVRIYRGSDLRYRIMEGSLSASTRVCVCVYRQNVSYNSFYTPPKTLYRYAWENGHVKRLYIPCARFLLLLHVLYNSRARAHTQGGFRIADEIRRFDGGRRTNSRVECSRPKVQLVFEIIISIPK